VKPVRPSNRRIAAALLSASALVVGGIAGFEGYRGKAYDDGVGVQTIGFGSTEAVRPGDTTDPVTAVQRLVIKADESGRAVSRCIGEVPLFQHEFDAFVSLAYNIGTSAFCASTLVKRLKQNPPDYAGACEEIKRWVRAGGRVLPGLVKRREAEYRMCLGIS
jgi:lysozyme